MEIITIKYFLSLARNLNFSAAAEENNISQSSFSKAIMRLERDMGLKLIDRSRHPIALTPAGECFYRNMSQIEPMFRNAMDELKSYTEGETIRIFISPRSGNWKMAFEDYMQQVRGIKIEYTESADFSQVTEQLKSGKYDFVLSAMPFNLPEDAKVTKLYDDELYLLVSEKSPFATRESVSLTELSGYSFYESVYSRFFVLELSRQFDFCPKAVYPEEGAKEMRREEVIQRVSMNRGMSLYSGRDLSMFRSAGMRCIPVQEVPDLPTVLLERAGEKDTPAKQQFRKWCQENMESYLQKRVDLERFNRPKER